MNPVNCIANLPSFGYAISQIMHLSEISKTSK